MSWIFMFILSGIGSSTLYWGFLDWAYYYQTPGLSLPPESAEALKYSVAYSFFHSGLSAWAIYALASISLCYSYHVRKNKGLSLASVIEAVTGFKINRRGWSFSRLNVLALHVRCIDDFIGTHCRNIYQYFVSAHRHSKYLYDQGHHYFGSFSSVRTQFICRYGQGHAAFKPYGVLGCSVICNLCTLLWSDSIHFE